MSPFKQAVTWVIANPGAAPILHRQYYHHANWIGFPAPAQNSPFGTHHPWLVREGKYVIPTEYGRRRAAAWKGEAA